MNTKTHFTRLELSQEELETVLRLTTSAMRNPAFSDTGRAHVKAIAEKTLKALIQLDERIHHPEDNNSQEHDA